LILLRELAAGDGGPIAKNAMLLVVDLEATRRRDVH
jgi:hypothetical protein